MVLTKVNASFLKGKTQEVPASSSHLVLARAIMEVQATQQHYQGEMGVPLEVAAEEVAVAQHHLVEMGEAAEEAAAPQPPFSTPAQVRMF